MFFNMPFLISK